MGQRHGSCRKPGRLCRGGGAGQLRGGGAAAGPLAGGGDPRRRRVGSAARGAAPQPHHARRQLDRGGGAAVERRQARARRSRRDRACRRRRRHGAAWRIACDGADPVRAPARVAAGDRVPRAIPGRVSHVAADRPHGRSGGRGARCGAADRCACRKLGDRDPRRHHAAGGGGGAGLSRPSRHAAGASGPCRTCGRGVLRIVGRRPVGISARGRRGQRRDQAAPDGDHRGGRGRRGAFRLRDHPRGRLSGGRRHRGRPARAAVAGL